MTASAESRRAYDAPWVDLSGLPTNVDPYASRVPVKDLSYEQWLTLRRTAVGS